MHLVTKKTEINNTHKEILAIKVADPYRWLEDTEGPQTKKWISSQNNYLKKSISSNLYKNFSKKLVKNYNFTSFSTPFPCQEKYFYTERKAGQNQWALYMKRGLTGTPTSLVDPNSMKKDGTVSISFWFPSRTEKYLVYGLSEAGNEMSTMYIRNLKTNKNLSEKITRCRYSSVCWLPDDSGFFYTRNPQVGMVPKNEEHLHTKVYFHLIDSDPVKDSLVFGKDRPKDDMLSLSLSLDGNLLAIHAGTTWTENSIFIYNKATKETVPLVTKTPAQFNLKFTENKVILKTNYKANNWRVLSTDISNVFTSLDKWKEIIKEQNSVIESLSLTKSKILVEYLSKACSSVSVFDHGGRKTGELPLSPYSSITDISANREKEEFFYGVTSFTFRPIIYRYDPTKKDFNIYQKTDNCINPDDYITKQEWCKSKDGTKIPLFVIHKKTLSLKNKNGPTILKGYGGFGVSETPSFIGGFAPWLEAGGIFVVANIRGGGEFGKRWHEAGTKKHKQNSFDDFIACANYLIKKGYTSSAQLGILGGSNGGLLVTTVAVQKPNLFRAVCSHVPLTDMVRFPLFGMASRWVHEYGDPTKKEELKYILKWSPYHNVKPNTEYPSFFFTTAEKDTRVNPLHARKMAALLQSVNKKNKVLLFTEKKAGHGPGKPIRKIIESQALTLAFFAQELGVSI